MVRFNMAADRRWFVSEEVAERLKEVREGGGEGRGGIEEEGDGLDVT